MGNCLGKHPFSLWQEKTPCHASIATSAVLGLFFIHGCSTRFPWIGFSIEVEILERWKTRFLLLSEPRIQANYKMVTPAAVILTILLNLYWEALHVFLAFKVKLISELVSCWCKYQKAALQGRWLYKADGLFTCAFCSSEQSTVTALSILSLDLAMRPGQILSSVYELRCLGTECIVVSDTKIITHC